MTKRFTVESLYFRKDLKIILWNMPGREDSAIPGSRPGYVLRSFREQANGPSEASGAVAGRDNRDTLSNKDISVDSVHIFNSKQLLRSLIQSPSGWNNEKLIPGSRDSVFHRVGRTIQYFLEILGTSPWY